MAHLQAVGLTKRYAPDADAAVDGVAFSVEEGELLALLAQVLDALAVLLLHGLVGLLEPLLHLLDVAVGGADDADVDLEFEVHLPDEYAEEAGEPVYATVARVPFKESVNPSAREQAKIHARDDMDDSGSRSSGERG